ncbi:MAG: hypothetical protein KDD47_19065, partial [Acidobacteria bacterium]|nr:hypothetical protein [Acidobacteriota bacterium]
WSTLSFGQTLTNPVFLAGMQTIRGFDPATVRYRNLSSTSVEIQIDEEESADSETTHSNPEVLGYIVVSR